MASSKNFILLLLALSIIIIGAGCGGDDGPTGVEENPVLLVSRATLDFGSEEVEKTFYIANSGDGTLLWSITSNENWLSVSPAGGNSTTEEDEVTVTVNRGGLELGQHNAVLTVTPNSGSAKTIAVTMFVPSPQLSLSLTSLEFGTEDNDLLFSIANIGGSTLEWSITSNEDWLAVSPSSGSTTSEQDEVIVTINRGGLPSGQYNGVLTVASNAGIDQTVSVQMTVQEAVLHLSESVLLFGTSENELTFAITNTGGGMLDWDISTNRDWLTCLPTSGSTTTGESVVRVVADRSDVSAGYYTGTITVSSNVGDETIVVSMYKGAMIWSFTPTTNTALDRVWDCYDDYDDLLSGEDYWGVVTGDGHSDQTCIWCNGRGNHPDGRYDNNMDARILLRPDEALDIRDYSEVTIRFWMKYHTEPNCDYIRFNILGNDGVWYHRDDTVWNGSDLTWKQYEVNLSDFIHAPDNFLRIGFFFNSDYSNGFYGASIDDIEVWGVE